MFRCFGVNFYFSIIVHSFLPVGVASVALPSWLICWLSVVWLICVYVVPSGTACTEGSLGVYFLLHSAVFLL